jgi:hypothetical protein
VRHAFALVISVLLAASPIAAGEKSYTEYSLGDSEPLDPRDLQHITLQVMQKTPLLSSSPGVKFVSTQRSVRSTDIADIGYLPHAESAGVKRAFQVRCERQAPNEQWMCGDVTIRRYLQLDSQDFAVRVTGAIGTEEALALIQATRETIQATLTSGSVVPETVIMILPEADGYRVAWGSHDERRRLTVKARLREDGDPVKPEDWQTKIETPPSPALLPPPTAANAAGAQPGLADGEQPVPSSEPGISPDPEFTEMPWTPPSVDIPSPLLATIRWASASSVVRKARGSDNWPMTWGNDGHMYTAYGDGYGFTSAGSSMPKLSLGFARIEGVPPSFNGFNIRSPQELRAGDGRTQKKASGMLMVNGVLYMLVRNADLNGKQSQLAWSNDRGKTWTWASWKFTTSFGYPAFVNFGRNYLNPRSGKLGRGDGYVYVVSHNHTSAYTNTDTMVMARAPISGIKTRSAYRFFAGMSNGQPLWSSDINQRRPIFTNPGKCRRSSMTYDAGLNRYLWWQGHYAGGDPKTEKQGFGIYDAPRPWGPWTTVYTTAAWDMPPGESAHTPSKWMSSDGKTFQLVFSGNDQFSVRKGTIVLR